MKINRNGFLAVLTVLSLVTAPAVYANEGGEREGKDPAKRVEHLKKKLGLNDDQAGKIKALFEAEKAEREARRKKFHDEMAGILTPEQLAKFEKMVEERKGEMKEGWAKKKKD